MQGILKQNKQNKTMKKKLKKTGTDGLMIYFTKAEQDLYDLKEGDDIDLDDMVVTSWGDRK